MKAKNIIKSGVLAIAGISMLASCANLDLQPLTEPSTGTWNSSEEEVRLSLNDMYRQYPYEDLENTWNLDRRTDDWAQREQMYDVTGATLTSTSGIFVNVWLKSYKAINRCNAILISLEKFKTKSADLLRAEARMFRAMFYARLVVLFGDVPFYTNSITLDEARNMTRTPKAEIMQKVYEDFDAAIAALPIDNEVDGIWRVNKGTALALKARYALYNNEWAKARDAAKACIDLGVYKLAPDYGALFRSKDYSNGESIFIIGRSIELGQADAVKNFMCRTAGGAAVAQPSWDLLAAYECTDGKPIDESPLFDPKNPYNNRDPRCNEVFVAPGTIVYGTEYDPDPDATKVMVNGVSVTNKDNKTSKNPWASFASTCLRKGAQDDWTTNGFFNDNPIIIIRYADILLMYAEAKIELNEIDQSVVDAINDVRARAYHAKRADVGSYPAITASNQEEMRLKLRKERRYEFPWEGRRFYDLLRWDWLKYALSHDYYGHLAGADMPKYKKAGKYYWPGTPQIDEMGFADFEPFYKAGDIARYGLRVFDPRIRIYNFPIPADEVTISNGKIINNEGW